MQNKLNFIKHCIFVLYIINVFCSFSAESICSKLIKFLTPATVVPEKAVVNTISYMCTNKPSTNIQVYISNIRSVL